MGLYGGSQDIPTEVNRDTLHYWNWIKQKGLYPQLKADFDAEFGGPKGAAPLACKLSVLPPEATSEAFAAQQTIQFLKSPQSKKQPFLAWSTFYRPHQPYTPQKKYVDQIDFSAIKLPSTLCQKAEELPPGLCRFRKSENRPWNFATADEAAYRTFIGYYIALVHEIDDHIQSILKVLEEEGLAKDTIIVYSSDHGDFVGNHGLVEKMALWHNFYEDTLHVPLIFNWPGHIGQGLVRPDLVELVDIYPTLLSLCGIPAPAGYPLAGRDLSATLLHESSVGRKYAISENWTQACVISNRFKYGKWLNSPDPKLDYRTWGNMLNDRVSDPNEVTNLINDSAHVATVKEMEASLEEWLDKTDDTGRREFYTRRKIPYLRA